MRVKQLLAKFLSIKPLKAKVLSEINNPVTQVRPKIDFRPASELSKEEYNKRYPLPCQKCETPNSISTNGWYCEQCIHDMSYNSYLDVYGTV
jgi:hypothetical protein